MRAGFLTPSLMVGGAEQHLVDLVRHTGPQVRWVGVALTDPRMLDIGVRARVEKVCPVGAGKDAAAQLARRVDVMVLWGIPRWWALLPDPLPCPVVLISHGSGEWTRRVLEGAGRAAAVVAVSRCALEPVPPEMAAKARVIYNGVDPARLEPRASREQMHREWFGPLVSQRRRPRRVIGYVGRFSAEKDCHALIRAVAALPPEWEGVFVGRGWDADLLRRQCGEAGFRVGVVNPRVDVGTVFGALDSLLLASREEGFGLVIAEAWMAGVPVVSTPVGIAAEHPELVRTVPVDAGGEELAAAFRADAADPEGTAARVALAQEVARRRYTAARFGREWTELLVEVASRAAAAGDGEAG